MKIRNNLAVLLSVFVIITAFVGFSVKEVHSYCKSESISFSNVLRNSLNSVKPTRITFSADETSVAIRFNKTGEYSCYTERTRMIPCLSINENVNSKYLLNTYSPMTEELLIDGLAPGADYKPLITLFVSPVTKEVTLRYLAYGRKIRDDSHIKFIDKFSNHIKNHSFWEEI